MDNTCTFLCSHDVRNGLLQSLCLLEVENNLVRALGLGGVGGVVRKCEGI